MAGRVTVESKPSCTVDSASTSYSSSSASTGRKFFLIKKAKNSRILRKLRGRQLSADQISSQVTQTGSVSKTVSSSLSRTREVQRPKKDRSSTLVVGRKPNDVKKKEAAREKNLGSQWKVKYVGKADKQASKEDGRVKKTGSVPKQFSVSPSAGTYQSTNSAEEMNCCLTEAKEPRLVWINRILDEGVVHLLRRFRDNMNYKPQNATYSSSEANEEKNRYYNIPCIDSTRVVLKSGPCDYIHANWVTMKDGRKFICTQGPLLNTMGDFWRMIVQEKCHMIVMLCRNIEYDEEKCAEYFPTPRYQSMVVNGTTTVNLKNQKTTDVGNIISHWTVEDRGESFELQHVQCTSWEDHSAPDNTLAVIEVLREILKSSREHTIVVHCSGGIGRTCTLVGVLLLLERIRSRKDATAVSLMKWLRSKRYGAIQKGIQFVFLHRVTIDMLCQEGVRKFNNEKLAQFEKKYQKLLKKQRKILKDRRNPEPPSYTDKSLVKTQEADDEDKQEENTILRNIAKIASDVTLKRLKKLQLNDADSVSNTNMSVTGDEDEDFLESEYCSFL